MLIAISANGPSPDSPMEMRFGRAAGFVVYDTDTKKYDYMDNGANAQLPQGAGIQSAQLLGDRGVSVIITGNIGPKAWQALSGGNIRMLTSPGGSVRDVVEQFDSGQLGEATPGPANAGTQQGQPAGQAAGQGTMQGGGCRRMGGTGMGRGLGRGNGTGMGSGKGRGGGRGMGGRGMGGQGMGGQGMGGGRGRF